MNQFPPEPQEWQNEADRDAYFKAKAWYEANWLHLSDQTRQIFCRAIRHLKITDHTVRPCTHYYGRAVRQTANWIFIPLMHFLWTWSAIRNTKTLDHIRQRRPELPLDDLDQIAIVNKTSPNCDLLVNPKTMIIFVRGQPKGPVAVVESIENQQATQHPTQHAIVPTIIDRLPPVPAFAAPNMNQLPEFKIKNPNDETGAFVRVPNRVYNHLCETLQELRNNAEQRFNRAIQQRDAMGLVANRFNALKEQLDACIDGVEPVQQSLLETASEATQNVANLNGLMAALRDAGQ